MRGNKTVVGDSRMMSDMITGPQDTIIANFYKRLDYIVLQNKSILANITGMAYGIITYISIKAVSSDLA